MFVTIIEIVYFALMQFYACESYEHVSMIISLSCHIVNLIKLSYSFGWIVGNFSRRKNLFEN